MADDLFDSHASNEAGDNVIAAGQTNGPVALTPIHKATAATLPRTRIYQVTSKTIMSAKSQTLAARRFSETKHVRFEIFYPNAKRVCVAGSFNGWNPTATPLVPSGRARWLRVLWLPPGTHEYLFVTDGQWMFDPNATDYVPNIFGGINAVINVTAPRECSRRLDAPTRSSLGASRTRNGKVSATRVPCFA